MSVYPQPLPTLFETDPYDNPSSLDDVLPGDGLVGAGDSWPGELSIRLDVVRRLNCPFSLDDVTEALDTVVRIFHRVGIRVDTSRYSYDTTAWSFGLVNYTEKRSLLFRCRPCEDHSGRGRGAINVMLGGTCDGLQGEAIELDGSAMDKLAGASTSLDGEMRGSRLDSCGVFVYADDPFFTSDSNLWGAIPLLGHTIAHEVGHAIGLRHTPGSVMTGLAAESMVKRSYTDYCNFKPPTTLGRYWHDVINLRQVLGRDVGSCDHQRVIRCEE